VLCTRVSTFAVKKVETTNLVLLIDTRLVSRDNEIMASATVNSHLELVLIPPKLQHLDAMLSKFVISEDDDAANEALKELAPSWEQLFDGVQASSEQLQAALVDRGAVCIDGRYWLVDAEYLTGALEVLLLTAAQQGWRISDIVADEAVEALAVHGYAPQVTRHCLTTFGAERDTDKLIEADSGTGVAYELDSAKVCRQFARRILMKQGKWESLESFTTAWKESLPVVSCNEDESNAGSLVENKYGMLANDTLMILLPFRISSQMSECFEAKLSIILREGFATCPSRVCLKMQRLGLKLFLRTSQGK
jgi:hypothetical protein